MGCDPDTARTVVSTIVCSLLLLVTIMIIASFIKFMSSDTDYKTTPKPLKYLGLTFYVITFVSMVMHISYLLLSKCIEQLFLIFVIGCGVQFIILYVLWLIILYYTLKQTPLQLSKTIRTITAILIVLLCISVIMMAVFNVHSSFFLYGFIGTTSLSVILVITFTSLFGNKLSVVNRKNDDIQYEQTLIDIVSKIGSLYFISLFGLIISVILVSVIAIINSDDNNKLSLLPLFTNIFSNFICIIFTFTAYDKYYQKTCKYPQKVCVASSKYCQYCCCCWQCSKWCDCCKNKGIKRDKRNNIEKMKIMKDTLTEGARSRLNYFVEIKQKIDDKVKAESAYEVDKSLSFGINRYISSITTEFKEVANLFTGYCIVHQLMSMFVEVCECKQAYIIYCGVIIVFFLVCQGILYYKNHKKVANEDNDNQRNCCCKWNGNGINTIVFLILMITKDSYPFSCANWLQSNMVYAFNITILGTIIAYIQFKKQYDAYEAENIDQYISKIDSMEKEDVKQYKEEFEKETQNVKYPKRQYVGYMFQLLAIRYQFEVSMVIAYTSIISVFEIIYNQCDNDGKCMDNDGELWLRLIAFVLFLSLAIIIQCKVNESWLQRVSCFSVTICLMYTAQTRTAQCLFEWTNIEISKNICTVIAWSVIVFVLVYELWKILKTKKPLDNHQESGILLSQLSEPLIQSK